MPSSETHSSWALLKSVGAVQGLLIYDGEGNIIYSRQLEEAVALAGIAIAKELGAPVRIAQKVGGYKYMDIYIHINRELILWMKYIFLKLCQI